MKFPFVYLISFVILVISCQQSKEKKLVSELIVLQKKNAIDSLVNSHYTSGMFSGAVLIAENGNVIYHQQFGYTKLDSSELISENTVFEIASLSKQFTAFLIMLLEEEEQIDYDDKIIKYFPKLKYNNITIRHLLTHTSGLSEKKFFQWARQNMPPSKIYHNEFILEYLINEQPDLAFEPGEKWEYSNLGYFLLPLLIKQKTGKHYIQVLKERIIEPLGLKNTGIYAQDHKGSQMENYAFGKVLNPQDSTFISSYGMAWSDSIYGGVGILSNTEDLFKWERSLHSYDLLDSASLSEAFIPYQLSSDRSSGYGFGWFISEELGKKRLDHYGIWPGYESSLVRFPDEDKTIIILTNQSPSAKDLLIEKISEILFGFESETK